MNWKKTLLVIIGTIIIFIIMSPKYCSSGSGKKSDTFIDTVHDTSWNVRIEKTPFYIPGPTQFLPGEIKWRDRPIDTLALLKDYFAKVIYHDTVWIDSFGFVSFHDTITKNRIAARQKEKNYKIPTITKTITKEIHHYHKQERQLNGGFLADPVLLRATGLISYEDRKDRIFHAGLSASPQGPSIVGGVSWPIKKKK